MRNSAFQHPEGPEYQRPLGFMQNNAVKEEILTLDPIKDCQRIVYLMLDYEFTHEITSALDVVYLASGGSPEVANILGRSHYLKNGMKRYDDTRFLILKFIESGWDKEDGEAAIRRMNQMHSKYRIENDQFVQALCSFIVPPILWIENFGWRKLTRIEKQAWYQFWVRIGEHMNIENIPDSFESAQKKVEDVTSRNNEPSQYSKALGENTLKVFIEKSPWYFKPFAEIYYRSFYNDYVREAFELKDIPLVIKFLVFISVKFNSIVRKFISPSPFPYLVALQSSITYGKTLPDIEKAGPVD